MTVREALEPMVIDGMLNARDLAPKIEAALRAAYAKGLYDAEGVEYLDMSNGENGVTAGIGAMQ